MSKIIRISLFRSVYRLILAPKIKVAGAGRSVIFSTLFVPADIVPRLRKGRNGLKIKPWFV